MKQKKKIQFQGKKWLAKNLFLICTVFVLLTGQDVFAENTNNYTEIEREIINQLNQERVDNNLSPLTFNKKLQQAAELKLNDMIQKGYFSHTAPDGSKAWYWLEQVGYDYKFAGENLATNFKNAPEVHRAWMKSVKHKENILFPKYTEVAVAVSKNKKGNLVAVELFGEEIGEKHILPEENILGSSIESGYIIPPEIESSSPVIKASPLSTSIIPVEQFDLDDMSWVYGFNNLILLSIGILCFILIVNIWVLEKEDEKILAQLG